MLTEDLLYFNDGNSNVKLIITILKLVTRTVVQDCNNYIPTGVFLLTVSSIVFRDFLSIIIKRQS